MMTTTSMNAARTGFRFLALFCLLNLAPIDARGQTGSLGLAVRDAGDAIEISWLSQSVTASDPYLHYEFQLQWSSDLVHWEELGPLIPGGWLDEVSFPRIGQIAKDEVMVFARLTYRLNMPGSDLSGLDFTGADLRYADLSNANLSGVLFVDADLAYADLSGSDLSGVDLAHANLDGVDLSQVDLGGVDLSRVVGRARFSQLNADPGAEVAEALPTLPFFGDLADYSIDDPDIPGIGASVRHAMVMFDVGTTVADLNAFLEKYAGVIVGSRPLDSFLPNAVCTVEFPTTTALELFELTRTLKGEPIVHASAPDILMGYDVVTDARNSHPDWKWNTPAMIGGNWGLKTGSVPQMWNVREALLKKGVGRIKTAVIDGGFETHNDLVLNIAPGGNPRHGMHVAGIIGATGINGPKFDNGIGIDGVNPFADLIGIPVVNEWATFVQEGGAKAARAQEMIDDARDALSTGPAIINMSVGLGWSCRECLGCGHELSVSKLARAVDIAWEYGIQFATLASTAPNTLFVVTAGNDWEKVPASLNSPMSSAALSHGANNIIVVGSHDPNGGKSTFSNFGGHVLAPGSDILSTVQNNAYDYISGTSQAAPFVSGVAGYLQAVGDSVGLTLNGEKLKILITGTGNRTNIEAYASLLEIDNELSNPEVLKMLLDIDDGTEDGNLREEVQDSPGTNRSFLQVTGHPDYTATDVDGDGGPGDGRIDMSDFRRWRDWLVFGDGGPHQLNGSPTHDKKDGNGDGVVVQAEETTVFPRGDFNGDGVLDNLSATIMTGHLSGKVLKDLDVLFQSGLWSDTNVQSSDLPQLIDSADIHASAKNFFTANSALGITEGNVSVYIDDNPDGWQDTMETKAGTNKFTLQDDKHIFTVPVGQRYYLRTTPIHVGGGTNVIMVSPAAETIPSSHRGADYADDLVLWQLTTTAKVQPVTAVPSPSPMGSADASKTGLHPASDGEELIISEPLEEEVDAHLPASESAGARGWANDQGTFYALAQTGPYGGLTPGTAPDSYEFTSSVVWQRSFVKDEDLSDPTFEVHPMRLELIDGRQDFEELNAFAEIRVEKRASGSSPEWETIFYSMTEIAGYMGGPGAHTFRIVDHQGDLPEEELKLDGEDLVIGASYFQPEYEGTIPLDDVQDGNSFEIRYTLNARATSWLFDERAEAYIGDPLDYGSGMRMEYGNFGELIRVKDCWIDDAGQMHVLHRSLPKFYFILYRITEDGSSAIPVAIRLGSEGDGVLIDPNPEPDADCDDYHVKNQPLRQPLDTDGDGIDDVYELNRPAILDPLNPADALLDTDGDGRNARQEYLDGTDPETPDEAPGGDDLYPAATFAIGEGGDLESADLNNDGIADLISFNAALYVSLGNADGTFAPPITVAIPDGGFIGDITLSDLNGDGFPDVVFADGTNDRVEVLFGDGSGGFVSDAKYDLGVSPRHAVLAHVNNDPHLDMITIHNSSRSVAVLIGNGDGTFQAPMTMDTTDRPTDATTALMNDDPHPDLVIALESGGSRVAVLLNNGDGTFAPMVTYPTGSFPQRMASGDVNGDGMADIITSNGSGNPANGVSVLLGNGDGTLEANVDYPTGASPRGFLLRDLDGDGDLDLLVAHVGNEANYHALLFNDGSGDFSELEIVPTSSQNQNVLLVDVDRDGLPDLISRVLTGQAMVTHGLPGGGFDTRVQINFDRGFSPRDFEIADVNADGRPDIVIANGGNFQTVGILINQGAGEFAKLPPLAIGEKVQGLALARFDEGPTLDLAVVTQRPEFSPGNSSNQLHVLHGDGTGAFTVAQVLDLHAPPHEILTGDFNGNRLIAILIGYNATGEVQLFINTGTEFGARAPVKVGEFYNRGVVGDFDGDGITDIAAVVWDGQAVIKVLRGASDGVLTESQVISPLNGGNAQTVAVGDINGDGRPDLLVTVMSGGMPSLVFYPGTEAGTFGDQQLVMDGFSGDISMVDVNQDGVPDLLSGSTIRLGAAGGRFGPPRTNYLPRGGFVSSLVIVADMNGDDRPDLVAADSSGVNILLRR